jgi:alanyl-tRNA synthetase
VTSTVDDGAASYLALLASKTVARGDASAPVIVALAGTGGAVTLAQTKGGAHHMGVALRALLETYAGKGGGAKDFAQATLANPAHAAEFLKAAPQAIAASH